MSFFATNIAPQRLETISSMMTLHPAFLTERATNIINLFFQSRGGVLRIPDWPHRQKSHNVFLDVRFAKIWLQSPTEISILVPRLRSLRHLFRSPPIPIRVSTFLDPSSTRTPSEAEAATPLPPAEDGSGTRTSRRGNWSEPTTGETRAERAKRRDAERNTIRRSQKETLTRYL